MPAVHIRVVPSEVVEALERRAARHHRSLEGELRSILVAVARQEKPLAGSTPLELRLSAARPQGDWGREEIYGDDGR